jgi:PAS domain S-box-containing protein
VIANDITEKKRTEKALEESEERLRVIAETSPAMISVTHAGEGTILYVNPAYASAFGYETSDLTGSKVADYYADPADREKLLSIVREKGAVNGGEVKVVRKDGTPFWISTSLSRITFDGEPAVIGSAVDITGRKEAEDALRTNNEELSRFNKAMVGRELQMIELKKEVNELCVKAGLPPRYNLDWDAGTQTQAPEESCPVQ